MLIYIVIFFTIINFGVNIAIIRHQNKVDKWNTSVYEKLNKIIKRINL